MREFLIQSFFLERTKTFVIGIIYYEIYVEILRREAQFIDEDKSTKFD